MHLHVCLPCSDGGEPLLLPSKTHSALTLDTHPSRHDNTCATITCRFSSPLPLYSDHSHQHTHVLWYSLSSKHAHLTSQLVQQLPYSPPLLYKRTPSKSFLYLMSQLPNPTPSKLPSQSFHHHCSFQGHQWPPLDQIPQSIINPHITYFSVAHTLAHHVSVLTPVILFPSPSTMCSFNPMTLNTICILKTLQIYISSHGFPFELQLQFHLDVSKSTN